MILLSLVGKLLQSEGYRVTRLERLSSMEELIELGADCFIIDEQLPNVSGHIICIFLKSKPQTKAVPVILMSAFKELEYFADLSGANAYLKKPFEKQDLLHVLNSAMLHN